MSDFTGIKVLSDQISSALDDMVKRANTLPQFLERNVQRKYLTAQAERWKSGNETGYTTGGWDDLSEPYATDKLHRFKNFPGAGTKMLVAKNKLVDSILAKSTDFRRVIGDKSMIISTVVPYAGFVDEKRTITKFNKKFYEEISDDLMAYVTRGKA